MSGHLQLRRRGEMSGSGSLVSDSFSRDDSLTSLGNADSGHIWVPNSGTWGIDANQGRLVSATPQATAVVDSGVADCTISVMFPEVAGQSVGLCFRSTDDNNHFVTEVAAAGVGIYRKQAGAFTGIADWATITSAGDVFEIVLSGSSITAKLNGTVLAQVSDAFNATATRHGLRSNNSPAARFDDFKVDSL